MESVTRLFQGLLYFRLVSVSDFLSFLRYWSQFSLGVGGGKRRRIGEEEED